MSPVTLRGTYITQTELAERLGVSQPAISQAIAAGRLAGVKIGTVFLIAAGEARRFEESRAAPKTPKTPRGP